MIILNFFLIHFAEHHFFYALVSSCCVCVCIPSLSQEPMLAIPLLIGEH